MPEESGITEELSPNTDSDEKLDSSHISSQDSWVKEYQTGMGSQSLHW
jgi:hypothetical protein